MPGDDSIRVGRRRRTREGATGRTSRFRFILVEPQSGGNVGAAARALKNLGFDRLDLVAPTCDPRGEEARKMAVDASDVLLSARVHDGLDSALEGAGAVVGTSRRKGKQRRPNWRIDELADSLTALATAGEVAILFGRETYGLTDEELDRCTHLAHFVASDLYPSFNLAQAVLLVAYEIRLALAGAAPDAVGPLADHSSREAMYAHLEAALRATGFVQEETAGGMMRRIRRILGRASLTPGDVRVLRGIARQTLWVARRAGIEIAGPATRDELDDDAAEGGE